MRTKIDRLVDHLFRHRAGAMLAALTRIFGPDHLELAEDLVQETLMKALRQWPYRGIPDDPEAWLARVARNLALDRLRHDALLRRKEPELMRWAADHRAVASDQAAPDELKDDELRLIFTCCHPAIPAESRVALTLKSLSGFDVPEIARALISRPTTIAQRLVRAKRKIREECLHFNLPESDDLPERLDSVHDVIYLMFNEGYVAHEGAELVRRDLVQESIRLASLLVEHPGCGRPDSHALLALMLFQGARLPARQDDQGELLLLSEQDRRRWDRRMIGAGFHHLELAASGDTVTSLHAEAGIASCHAAAGSFEETSWETIVAHYDLLIQLAPSPIASLNRAVAISMRDGPRAGLTELDRIDEPRALSDYYLLPATRGELLLREGNRSDARPCFERALKLAGTAPEKRFLRSRLALCE